jgi:CTP:molybdopterin cytidylyltransferase MocA
LREAQLELIPYQKIRIRVIVNKNPALGSFSTLQTVLQQIPKNKSVLVNPIDIPILNTTELQKIIGTQNQIVQPNYKGKNGHPIKLNSDFWKTLLLLDPTDHNSRLDLEIRKMIFHTITTIEVNDSCILKNLNTPQDWMEYIK